MSDLAHARDEGNLLESVRQTTVSPSSKYVVCATAYVYRELYGKITDRKKNCVNNYLN